MFAKFAAASSLLLTLLREAGCMDGPQAQKPYNRPDVDLHSVLTQGCGTNFQKPQPPVSVYRETEGSSVPSCAEVYSQEKEMESILLKLNSTTQRS